MSDDLTNEEKDLLDEAEEFRFKKEDWLKAHGYTEGDVMTEEDGEEYVMSRPDEDGKMVKLYMNDVVNQSN